MMNLRGSSLKDSNPHPFLPLGWGHRPARPSCAPTDERPPSPHACSTRLAVLRVCFWEWMCCDSTWRCCEQNECFENTYYFFSCSRRSSAVVPA
jgi:hypothetical protein